MGLGINVVGAILREHKYRPIDGDVLLMGRQAVYFSPAEILELLHQNGIEPRLKPEQITLDKTTLNRNASGDKELITDTSLFKLLGAKSVCALDHSDYEGAEVIHDLTKPLPEHLKGIADFIVDGSTLDNTFNPALTIQNYAE
ncbi:MAG: hypothetical protein KBB55_04180, partial [Candidatus Buchananbacteria bacterium]|nr:hypothetical protein [Candidatus Buchananbacteria bacterium]